MGLILLRESMTDVHCRLIFVESERMDRERRKCGYASSESEPDGLSGGKYPLSQAASFPLLHFLVQMFLPILLLFLRAFDSGPGALAQPEAFNSSVCIENASKDTCLGQASRFHPRIIFSTYLWTHESVEQQPNAARSSEKTHFKNFPPFPTPCFFPSTSVSRRERGPTHALGPAPGPSGARQTMTRTKTACAFRTARH